MDAQQKASKFMFELQNCSQTKSLMEPVTEVLGWPTTLGWWGMNTRLLGRVRGSTDVMWVGHGVWKKIHLMFAYDMFVCVCAYLCFFFLTFQCESSKVNHILFVGFYVCQRNTSLISNSCLVRVTLNKNTSWSKHLSKKKGYRFSPTTLLMFLIKK